MAVCPKCNANVPDNAAACPQCGAAMPAVPGQPAAPVYQQPGYQQPGYQPPMPGYQQPYAPTLKRQLNTGMLVWSIINLFLCTIMGIIGLVYTVTAQDAVSDEEEQQKLKTAKTLNLIGSIVAAVSIVISIVVAVVLPALMIGGIML